MFQWRRTEENQRQVVPKGDFPWFELSLAGVGRKSSVQRSPQAMPIPGNVPGWALETPGRVEGIPASRTSKDSSKPNLPGILGSSGPSRSRPSQAPLKSGNGHQIAAFPREKGLNQGRRRLQRRPQLCPGFVSTLQGQIPPACPCWGQWNDSILLAELLPQPVSGPTGWG